MSNSSGEMKSVNGKVIKIEYFTEARVDLMREVNHHPQLCEYIAQYNQVTDWSEIIGEIAAYLGTLMDGMYIQSDLEIIYKDMIRRLKNKRSIIQVIQ